MSIAAVPVRDSIEEPSPTTRCRILAKAEQAFRDVGYQKTTVADIAKSLRMSPANVYRFFESKKAIHEAVLQRLMDETEQRAVLAAVAPGRSASERIAGVIRLLHEVCLERCNANPRMHEMIEAAITESWDVCRRHIDRIGVMFATLVTDGVANGEFTVTDPNLSAACIHTAILRYCHPALVSHYPDAGAPPVEAMIDFLLGGLRPKV